MMLLSPWPVMLVLLVTAVVAAVWASERRDHELDEIALQVLYRRLTDGELTVEEHAQRRKALREHGDGSRLWSAWWFGPTIVLTAATLVVILLISLRMTSWSENWWMGGQMG